MLVGKVITNTLRQDTEQDREMDFKGNLQRTGTSEEWAGVVEEGSEMDQSQTLGRQRCSSRISHF